MNTQRGNRRKRRRGGPCPRGCAVVLDEKGVAVRVLPNAEGAYRWLDKHRPGLTQDEKKSLVRRLPRMKDARDEFRRQIELGCSDADVLVMLTFFDGTITARGLDLKACRPKRNYPPAAV